LAFADIVLLWLLIVATLVSFWRVRPLAGALLIPYLLWVSFATALNFSVWQLNPPASEKTWVHCAANMRVSAFMYKYRCEILNENAVKAKVDLEKIWEPFGAWKNFISKT